MIALLLAMLAALPAAPALADPAADLDACIQTNTSAEERQALLRLLLLAFAEHPAVADDVSVAPGAVEQSAKDFSSYFEEVLVIDCLPEARAAAAQGGGQAVSAPFARQIQQAFGEIQGTTSGVLAEAQKYMDMDEIGGMIGLEQ